MGYEIRDIVIIEASSFLTAVYLVLTVSLSNRQSIAIMRVFGVINYGIVVVGDHAIQAIQTIIGELASADESAKKTSKVSVVCEARAIIVDVIRVIVVGQTALVKLNFVLIVYVVQPSCYQRMATN